MRGPGFRIDFERAPQRFFRGGRVPFFPRERRRGEMQIGAGAPLGLGQLGFRRANLLGRRRGVGEHEHRVILRGIAREDFQRLLPRIGKLSDRSQRERQLSARREIVGRRLLRAEKKRQRLHRRALLQPDEPELPVRHRVLRIGAQEVQVFDARLVVFAGAAITLGLFLKPRLFGGRRTARDQQGGAAGEGDGGMVGFSGEHV